MGKNKVKVCGFVRCAKCRGIIHGVPKTHRIRDLSLSEKRVERIFGGYLCSKCVREVIKERVREMTKKII